MGSSSSGKIKDLYDVCVIGGGINGTGIARDAAGRGLSVLLLEAGDLAGATSSASTKLIHGGLRYLEQYEFKLVMESLAERERLLRAAPHLVRPQEFILPHEEHGRPAWMIRSGLFIYDHLKKRTMLPGSRAVDLQGGSILNARYRHGFSYHDCWVDDARLVVLNAIDAAEKGADISVRSECRMIEPVFRHKGWRVSFFDHLGDRTVQTRARMIINAAGPWVYDVLVHNRLRSAKTPGLRLIKGSHIIVGKLYDGVQAYILQQPDGRVVFAIPYEKNLTVIGTTEVAYSGNPGQAQISPEEIDYLCAAVNRSFEKQTVPGDIVWTYSGVRSLVDSGDENLSEVTRDYKLNLEYFSHAPVLSVFGGKLTTYRHLSERVGTKIASVLCGAGPAWTRHAVLPGGDIPGGDFKVWLQKQAIQHYWLPEPVLRRYAQNYGTRMDRLLRGAGTLMDLGIDYGDQLYEAEVRYLVQHEWARTSEDILWRRSKLGLHVKIDTVATLENALPQILKEVL
ncbi:MAG: glycerol-3-phosphate dehydrogenase [Alphaproteobacteria bacterium]